MDSKFNIASLKLLADPHKLKISRNAIIQYDGFRQSLESKFNCTIDSDMYSHILMIIQTELTVDYVIKDIINRVILNHNP